MYRIDAARSKNSGFLVTFFLIGMVALSLVSTPAPAVVPNPTVIGPIVDGPIGDASHNYPMASADPAALAAVGYLQQEFFVSGFANCYDTPRLATGGVIASGQPYMTRMMVRRPISAADFNGVVVVEWLNASSGYDIDSTWAAANSEAYIRAGSAWVGVTLQNITVQFLRTWGPARYGSLNVEPDPASLPPSQTCRLVRPTRIQQHRLRYPAGRSIDPESGGVDPWLLSDS
jgi:hypothetical protein